jgi:hypothetical protein
LMLNFESLLIMVTVTVVTRYIIIMSHDTGNSLSTSTTTRVG